MMHPLVVALAVVPVVLAGRLSFIVRLKFPFL